MLAGTRTTRRRDEGGFTLIELLVVIIIIGILAAIAIPAFLNQRKKGYEASEKSDLKALANEMEAYFAGPQTYPSVFTVTGPTTSTPAGNVIVGTTKVSLSRDNTPVLEFGNNSAKGFCISMSNSATGGAKNWYYDKLTNGINSTGCSVSTAY